MLVEGAIISQKEALTGEKVCCESGSYVLVASSTANTETPVNQRSDALNTDPTASLCFPGAQVDKLPHLRLCGELTQSGIKI